MHEQLLFYNAYEDFYTMAATSPAFHAFCCDAYGADFSQDGFSDLWQVEQILPHIPRHSEAHVLDIGCGNGKMLGYLQKQTGAVIHGFDYSHQAIAEAKKNFPNHSVFQVGVIGQQDYRPCSFDTVISMDTLYFAPDMNALLQQIKRWLKPDGVFFAGYQEGDVIPKTSGWEASQLAQALRTNGMSAHVTDITHPTWEMLCRKRQAAQKHQQAFVEEGLERWYELLIQQTDCAAEGYEPFAANYARYLVVVRCIAMPNEGLPDSL